MGISNRVKSFIFILLCFCFALAWQTTNIQVFSSSININYLVFVCFYFYYLQSSFPKSTLLIIICGFCYDALNSNPLFLTSTTMLIICFILHFYVRQIAFVGGFGFDGVVFLASMIVNYLLSSIFMLIFTEDNVLIKQNSFFMEVFYTLLFYIVATPLLNFIYSLIIEDENHLQMKINTIK
jgi:hypothetical protein